MNRIDEIEWRVTPPANDDQDDTLTDCTFIPSMMDDDDNEDELTNDTTLKPIRFGRRNLNFVLAADCAADYTLIQFEIRKDDDLNTPLDSAIKLYFPQNKPTLNSPDVDY